jgi:Zn-dependent protease with chaperone function
MTTIVLSAVASLLCLVALPEMLHTSRRFDANPRAGLTIWVAMCTIGWLSAIILFLKIGLRQFHGPLLHTTISFVDRLGDGHPLRGLGLSEVVGLSVALDITVLLAGGLTFATWKIWEMRHAQRTVLDLVAENDEHDEGISLLRHPQPLAYYLPGDGGRVVLSTGAIDVLSRRELAAVVSHEEGHRHGRHGALLIPLQVLSPFVSFLPVARYGPEVMRTYLEMSADDYARARVSAPALRAALEKSSLFHRPPRGALGMHDAVVERRLHRLERGAVPMLDQATLLGVSGAALSLFWTLLMVR